MRLAVKSAVLCGTGAFLIATYTSMMKTLEPNTLALVMQDAELLKNLFNPMEILAIAVPGGLIVGTIGYFLGDIFSKPADPKKKKSQRRSASFDEGESLSLSGDEVFLDDLDMEPLPDDVVADAETADYTEATQTDMVEKYD